jgi:hypothetical protein
MSKDLLPMKKFDTLNEKLLKPRKQTIDFLLNYSKSLEIMKLKKENILVFKN